MQKKNIELNFIITPHSKTIWKCKGLKRANAVLKKKNKGAYWISGFIVKL